MYYDATILQMSGVYNKSYAVWLSCISASMNFFCTFIGFYFVEKAGRRPVTLVSLAGVILSLIFLSTGFQVSKMNTPNAAFTSPEAVDAYCATLTSCNQCIANEICGFCFDDNFATPNGTCLKANNFTGVGSYTGLCTRGTRALDKIVWATDWCPSPYSWMTLVGLSTYIFAFAPGMGAMPWTINAEIYPLHARSVCLSVATGFCW